MKKKLALIFGVVILISGLILFEYNQERVNKKAKDAILYSWKLDEVKKEKEKFLSILTTYSIHTLYQDFSSEYFEKKDSSFIKEMNDLDIVVFHLAGDASWGKEDGAKKIKKEIDKVYDFNNNSENKIKGLILDIEPYISEKEEKFAKDDFKTYVNQIKESYKYIKNKNLELRVAIPYWFDSIDIDLLEELIKNTDGISVMNYNINKTSKNIKNELKFAKMYHKQIDTIYEVKYNDKDYFPSHEEILRDYELIKNDHDTDILQVSYHHFGSM